MRRFDVCKCSWHQRVHNEAVMLIHCRNLLVDEVMMSILYWMMT